MKRLLACALLALTSIAFGATLSPVQLLNPSGSTIGQAIISTGPTTAPAWGNVTATSLAPQPSNTVMANATGSLASPTAFAMPSCSGANNALRWTSGAGFTCASSIALTSGALSQFAATTSAQLQGVISDETGSGSLVFGTSPTIASPTITGAFTATGLVTNADLATQAANTVLANVTGSTASPAAFAMPNCSATTGVLTYTAGTGFLCSTIVNVTNGIFSGTITPAQTGGIVGTTTNNNANAGSVGEFVSSTVLVGSAVTISTGVSANVTSISLAAGDWDVWGSVWTNPGGTTTQSLFVAGISTTSASLATPPNNGATVQLPYAAATGAAIGAPVGTTRLSLSATTTVFLVANVNFGVSTNAVYGFIGARRRR